MATITEKAPLILRKTFTKKNGEVSIKKHMLYMLLD